MKKIKLSQRLTSIFLCLAMLLSYLPISVAAAKADLAPKAVAGAVTDAGTADSWEYMMGTDLDGNRYAGRVWVDKSVYKNGDIAKLNSSGGAGSSFRVSLEDDEAFQVVFSALGSSMSTKESFTSSGPMDVVLVLDTSTSMDDVDRAGVTRLQRTIEAANLLLGDLLSMQNIRIAIVTYNKDSETVIPLSEYKNGVELVVTDYFNNGSSDAGVVTAYDKNRNVLGKDSGYTMGTNLQSGIDRGFNILANATNVEGRVPVAIVLTDGQANRASQEGFYEISGHSDKDGTSAGGRNLYLSTLLNAAYNKTKIEARYNSDATVYTVGVDVSNNNVARLLMDPANNSYGFNSSNSDREIREAYSRFRSWANGQNVSYNNWNFNHNYPKQNGLITDAKIAANINYADTYYDVSNADIADTFEQIYQELSSGVFNPISSTIVSSGATGVEHTPLIYVDFIGQHMEVKEIQAISLFGNSYNVIKNENGTYTVDTATGTNPSTNEAWNTSEDILISLTEQANGTQKLEIRINQEILPILTEQVSSQTIGSETSATIVETRHNPLRVFYTIGVDSDILLPNGHVDLSAVSGYEYLDAANGKITFFANDFGTMNAPDGNGTVLNGDAHVGFKPSPKNRYYYHQSNQGIFTMITDKSGAQVHISPNDEFGIVWDETKYNLNWMTLNEYRSAKNTDTVYTYVTYYRPTPSTTDDASSAEEVTYLVYMSWEYLKESVSFFDNRSGKYINYDANAGYALADEGVAIPLDKVDQTLAAYTQASPSAEIYAVLGVGSLRTSRLHNMMVAKAQNLTGTAVNRYSPEYTHETASVHNGNDVVVWLGNNGAYTIDLETGIALTKNVTRPMGDADDLYALTVNVPAGTVAAPVVTDANGDELSADRVTYSNNVLTVKVHANETVYVSGIPQGTVCTVDESIPVDADYYISSKTATVQVPTISQVLAGSEQYAIASVTNAPNEYGNLYITKEITSEHNVPESVLNTAFDIVVNFGSALKGKVFDVQLDENGTVTKVKKTVDNNGNITLSIKARHTIEIFKIPAGTSVTVTENVPGSHFSVSYRTRNHSGENSDADNAVIIPENANATAILINDYTPGATSVELDISGTKNFIVEDTHPGAGFDFKVQKYENGTWVDVPGKTASVHYVADESGKKYFTIDDVLNGVTFNSVGSFAFRVLEVKGSVANVAYDRTLHSFNVHVRDENGQLVAKVVDEKQQEISDGTYEVLFTNTYHTAPVNLTVKKQIENKSGDTLISAEGFEFKAVRTDVNWIPLTGNDAAENSLFTDASGVASFTNVCTVPGLYYFILSEVEDAAKASKGWTYSKAVYRVTVEVVATGADLTATLSVVKTNSDNPDEIATVDSSNPSSGSVVFENTYDPQDVSVNLDGFVSKNLTGKSLEPNEFIFYVYRNNDRSTPVSVGTNDLNGDVKFVNFEDELVFSGVGKYEFDIVEKIPDGAIFDATLGKFVLNGMGYDPVIFDLVVEVTNDLSNGKLVANYYFEDSVTNVVTFYNTYSAIPAEYLIEGNKTLHGRSTRSNEFFFEIYENGVLLETVSNRADGTFSFERFNYTEAGVYTYVIKEKLGSVPGVSYEGVNHPVTVVVTVTDHNGVLSASADIKNSDIKFENTYKASSAKLNFSGTKTLSGGTLKDGDFSFKLHQTGSDFDINGGSVLQTVSNVGNAFTFAPHMISAAGSYFFVISEDLSSPAEGIVYDRALHRYEVIVTDVGSGQLLAVLTEVDSGISTSASATVSAKADFVNAVFDEVTEKEVKLPGSATTSIDGKKVNPGDILTYYITYTNFNNQDVVVDIMDTIPNFTSYVEGSASHGGTYVGTHLDWVLSVKKGESVTVSFNVKVDDPEAIMTNTAIVRDGFNTFKTNEVVNHTIDEVVKKDVFNENEPEISIDGEKVYEGDELVYTISYTNVSGQNVDLTIEDVIPQNTTYVIDSADFDGIYNAGKLTWAIEDVEPWATVTVSFKVAVNAKIGAANIANEATVFDGINTYKTNKVTNHTVSDDAKKDVYFANDVSASIDGKHVQYGDELVYAITYKNTDSKAVEVTVTDILPVFVTLVEGSVTDEGVYNNGTITWTLNVAPGESKTVSFKVKVTGVGGKTVENTAVITEGKNIYTSNTVSNTIEMPNPVIPNTGDGSNLALWFALLFVSGTAIFVIPLVARKRKAAK